MTIGTTSSTVTHANAHNIIVLNEKRLEVESENLKLKDDLSSLWEEMKKRIKVADNLIPLKEKIM